MKWWRGQAHLSPHLGFLLLLIHSLPLDPPALEQQWEGMARLSFERVIWVWHYLKAEVFSHETPLAFLRNTSPGHWGAPTVVSQHRCLLQLAAITSPQPLASCSPPLTSFFCVPVKHRSRRTKSRCLPWSPHRKQAVSSVEVQLIPSLPAFSLSCHGLLCLASHPLTFSGPTHYVVG